jgi:hypothetical protein
VNHSEIEKTIFLFVEKKLTMKEQEMKAAGEKIVYTKAWILEDELLLNDPPKDIFKMKSSYRKGIFSKCFHKLGYVRQGNHNYHPLWKKVIA